MKKTAVLLYDSFCYFEISVALEILALAGKPVVVFGRTKDSICSEDGLHILPDACLEDLEISEYDSLILPGAADIRDAIEDDKIIDFIRKFQGLLIGAISIAPLLLVKAGLLNGKPFMAGINKEEVMEEGFSEQDLQAMVGWNDSIQNPVPEGYLVADRMITSVSYQFVKWGLAFGKLLGIEISPASFEV